ncbi:MAG: OmpA family protein [Flavobacteriaceae bacterium]|jgi:OOP family OmpA-OmpF porin|nr:OmpA family protein [Flavobacteriaceae bacterium]
MKLNLVIATIAIALPLAVFAQTDSTTVVKSQTATVTDSIPAVLNREGYPNTFSSGSANIYPFTNKVKRFNDWAISAGVGVPLLQSSDLTSIKNGNGKNLYGYSAYLSVDKAITHAFGLKLQYDKGETKQGWYNIKNDVPDGAAGRSTVAGKTQYDAISIIGDINFSNILRRVDNKSPFRWAFHGYFGGGMLSYKAYQKSEYTGGEQTLMTKEKFGISSLFMQAGTGVKYKVSKSLDIEGRLMYVVSGDDEFDGGGDYLGDGNYATPANKTEEQISDNFFNVSVGVTLNIGKHQSHLFWHDPLQEIYYKLDVLTDKIQDVEVCKQGDNDNDGVCDDWDRQLDTPPGARVDGAGVALDADLDGVIDLFDLCVTVPGPVENNGCPLTPPTPPTPPEPTPGPGVVIGTGTELEGIEFDFDSDRILPSNTPILDNAVTFINSTDGSYRVIGGTDAKGSDAYNQKLSERRANSVRSFLIKNGVQSSKLEAIGRGEKDLKYPECNPAEKCEEWKNRANRRVYFETK